MPFIPHTEADIQEMLGAIGASKIDDLFDEIPAELLSAADYQKLLDAEGG